MATFSELERPRLWTGLNAAKNDVKEGLRLSPQETHRPHALSNLITQVPTRPRHRDSSQQRQALSSYEKLGLNFRFRKEKDQTTHDASVLSQDRGRSR